MMIGAKDSESRYGWISMTLHWGIVISLGLSVGYAYYRGFLPRDPRDARGAAMALHSSWSWVAMVLILARMVWRLKFSRPRELNTDRRLILAHKTVVGLLNWLPWLITATGAVVIMSVTRPVPFFGFALIPGLAERDRALHRLMEDVHIWIWYLLLALAAVHIGAALWHHLVKKDDTLNRMSPLGKVSD